MTQQTKDLNYGNGKENTLLPMLNKHYKANLEKTEAFYEFDFIDTDKKILIELKSRRNDKHQYYDTMIGANKIPEGLKRLKDGYKVFFIFDFTDCICAFELLESNINENWYREGGRKDRNKDEIKQYCFIPNKTLINIFLKNKSGVHITLPKMTDQTPTTTDQKPLSFSKRLINHITSEGKKTYEASEIENLINAFSTMEYEKRKEKTDEMPFGKYKFRKVVDVAKFDSQYLKWLIKQQMMDKYEDLKNEIMKHIK